MTVREAVRARRSMRSFDPAVYIGRDEILALLDEAAQAPSALNLQPWSFILCMTPEDKARLRAVSFDQQKLSDASAVVVVLGRLALHEAVSEHPDQNCFPPEDAAEWGRLASFAYDGHPERQAMEAFRSCSLFAMTFVLLAQDAGWQTAPVGGFEAEALCGEFRVPSTHIPVLLIAIGKEGTKKTLPRRRLAIAATLRDA